MDDATHRCPLWSDGQVTLHLGDCIDVMRSLASASVDAVVTDPPYGLEFMGREWDSFKPSSARIRRQSERDRAPGAAHNSTTFLARRNMPESYSTGAGKRGKPGIGDRDTPWVSNQGWNGFRCRNCGHLSHGGSPCTCETPDFARADERWNLYQEWCTEWAAECLRVLKPGAHLLAFGGTRTWHRLCCAIEDAGFEIRDSIHWIYGQGFPKSLNLDGEHEGWGTALKPAHEPIVVARKPLAGSVKQNVLTHGTGALNIAACRLEPTGESRKRSGEASQDSRYTDSGATDFAALPGVRGGDQAGRWPPNVLIGPDAAEELDRQSGVLASGKMYPTHTTAGVKGRPSAYGRDSASGFTTMETYGDSGGASRFFPVFRYEPKAPSTERPRGDDGTAHPTVKPLDLMCWLVRLVTPPGGLVLDPFAGSGTTGEACVIEGFRCILAENDPASADLARKRLSKPIQMTLEAS